MRKAIVQYYIDTSHYSDPDYNNLSSNDRSLVSISRKSFESYAEKIGVDFLHIDKPKLNYKHPTFERFDLWLDNTWWQKYDQILYVDSDVFAMPDAPDVFETYPDLDTFKICESSGWQKGLKELSGILEKISKQDQMKYGFQTGVFMLTKYSAQKMRPWISRYRELDDHDGHIMVWSAVQSQVPVERMDWRYNYKRAYYTGHPEIYFFHAQGKKKEKHHKRIHAWLHGKGLC